MSLFTCKRVSLTVRASCTHSVILTLQTVSTSSSSIIEISSLSYQLSSEFMATTDILDYIWFFCTSDRPYCLTGVVAASQKYCCLEP